MSFARSSRVGGKVAIVTGAGLNERGLNIGGATARLLASEGARVLVATRTGRDGEALADVIRSEGGE
ncbi:MAG TPA: oxidoreductase, partial [Sphingobium sp.]|nr:oxidoreductase [Sphingobium sp.]